MAIITEDYVSFETAKLLKKKGFTGDEIHKYYDISDEKPILYSESYIHEFDKDFWMKDLIMVPTHQMAMKWLREVHNILIVVDRAITHYYWELEDNKTGDDIKGNGEANTFEEACEMAIRYCLENLI